MESAVNTVFMRVATVARRMLPSTVHRNECIGQEMLFMKDIFYLCPRKLELVDLYELLQLHKIACKCFWDKGVIQTQSRDQWMDFNFMDREEFEEKDQILFQEKKIQTIICISYHIQSKNDLRNILRILLETTDGVIGSDSDAFEPIFSINDMEDQFE